MTEKQDERRQAKRVSANLNLEVKLPRPDGSHESATLETINISSSGIYFKSDHFIEPMTKLAMELEVRVPVGEAEPDSGTALVPCEGLVVRTTPEASIPDCDNYEVAVFFTHIEPEGMSALESHIGMLMDGFE